MHMGWLEQPSDLLYHSSTMHTEALQSSLISIWHESNQCSHAGSGVYININRPSTPVGMHAAAVQAQARALAS